MISWNQNSLISLNGILCVSRSRCRPWWRCHGTSTAFLGWLCVCRVNVHIPTLWKLPSGDTQRSTVSAWAYAIPDQVDLHLGGKWSTQFPSRLNVQNPRNVFLESTLSRRTALRVTGMEGTVSHLLPSIGEDLILCYRKVVHRRAASAASGNLLEKQNGRPDFY